MIPINNLISLSLDTNNSQLFEVLQEHKSIVDGLLKAKYLNWKLRFLDDILDIKRLLPEHYSCISYSLWSIDENSLTKDIDIKTIKCNEFAFSSIQVYSQLTTEEYKCVWELLCSHKTKFRISTVELAFNLLSEWLYVLKLCWDCPSINCINLSYTQSDLECDEQEVINKAIWNFREKIWIIESFLVSKY